MLNLRFPTRPRQRPIRRIALRTFPALAVLLAIPAAASVIEHEPAASAPSGQRIEVGARIEDEAGVGDARLYFKAMREASFLFVEMEGAPEGGDHVGTLPAPAPGATAVQYIILYRNGEDELFRSPVYEVAIEDRSDSTAYDEPLDVYTELAEVPDAVAGFRDNIVLDVVESGARYGLLALDGASMPGSAASSSGTTAGTTGAAAGGGMGAVGTTAAVAAAAAGVAVAADNSGDSGSSEPEPPPPPPPPSNEAPTFDQSGTLALQVDEGTTGDIGDPVGATDPDGDDLTYSLSGADAGAFAVDSATGQLSVPASTDLDFETRTDYAFDVEVSDGELSASRSVEVTVTNVNEQPAFDQSGTLALEVVEGTTGNIGDPVGATDPDGDDLTYSLSGADAAAFAVDSATGQLSVAAGTDLDFETRTGYAFDIVVSDGALSASRTVEVAVTNANEAPAFDQAGTLALDVHEGTTGDFGAPVTATDPDGDDLTYSLSGADAALFAIDSATGQLSVPASTTLDFDTRTDYTFDVVVSDGELTASRTVELTVTDANRAPVFDQSGTLALDVPERTTGAIGAPVTATDPDNDDLTYSLSGADAAAFAIDSATGQLSVAAATDLDFDTRTDYAFDVVVSDGALTATRRVEVTVTDANRAPTFDQSGTLELDVPDGTTGDIGAPVTATDPDDDDLTYELAGADAALFAIDSATGQLSVPATTDLSAAARADYTFDVVVSDGKLTASRTVEVTVTAETSSLRDDWLALRALYIATDGANWNNSRNWSDSNTEPTEDELDAWFSVTVRNGRVTELYLPENNLVGSLPPEMGNLTKLERLDLNGNRLTGSIPTQVGMMSSLRALLLNGNRLTGSIPSELGGLSNLDALYLHSNRLSGAIPPALGRATQLRLLLLSNNDLAGSIPEELGGLSRLVHLHLRGNELTGNVPTELGDLLRLEELLLQSNRLTGPLPDSLTTLTAMDQLFWQSQTVSAGQTALCAPRDTFETWLATLAEWGGPYCGASAPLSNAPRVTGVTFASSPGPDGAYTTGETVEVAVRFDRPVTVSGAPRLLLGLGAATAPMALASSSGAALVFRYEVRPGDVDLDGVSVGPAALRLEGGEVVATDGVPVAAELSGHAVTDDPRHVVDARSDAAEGAILEDTLAAQARAHLASASDVVDSRFRAGPTQGVQRAAGALTGLGAASSAWNGSNGPLHAEAPAGGFGGWSSCGADPLNAGFGDGCGAGGFGGPSAYGSSGFASPGFGSRGQFALRLGGDDETESGGVTLWGTEDRRTFAGETAAGDYDGDLRSRYLGVDRRFGRWLVGAALSRSAGEAAYDSSAGTAGVLRTNLNVLLPYAGGRLANGLEAWGMAGFGNGDAALVREDETTEAGRLRLGFASAGLRREAKDFGWLKLSVLADAGFARLATESDPGSVLDGLSASVSRLRAGVEGEHVLPLAGGALRPFWRATGRVDGGDGITGTGLELAGGARFGSPRVEAEVQGHWLAAGLAGTEEFGASATLRIKPRSDGTGFSASLSPRWGAVEGGSQSVWEDPALQAGGRDYYGDPPWSVDGRLDWGMVLPNAGGVFAPFVELRVRGSSTQRVGWRLERNIGRSLLGVEFGLGRVERPQGAAGAAELSVQALF